MLFHLTLKTSHSQFKKLPKIFTTKILCQPLPLFNFPLYFSSLSSFFLLFLFSPLFIPNVLNSSPPPAPGEDIENFIHPCFQSNTMKLVKQFTSPPPKVTKKVIFLAIYCAGMATFSVLIRHLIPFLTSSLRIWSLSIRYQIIFNRVSESIPLARNAVT